MVDHISWTNLNSNNRIKEVYSEEGLIATWIEKMYKNETIEITPLQNGYMVEYSFREVVNPEAKDSYDKYEFVREKFMFKEWDEVVDYISNKKLEVPPARI